MAKKPTQAERFWQTERARKVARRTPVGVVYEVQEPFPAARLMQPREECSVDPAIREALEAGLLHGPFDAIRADLAVVCAMAWGAAGAVYKAQLAAPELRDRQAKAARLAEDLRRFVASMEDEAKVAAELADDWGDKADAVIADSLRAIVEHGKALLPALEWYAEPEPVAQSAPAVDHLQREFFKAVGKWWADHAIDPDRRGAKAVRNRLAIGLWLDMERPIPDGYGGDDDFARRGFSLGKIEA